MKETDKLNLILGSHAHVPSGAGESEFEFVYEKKMRPFVANLYRYSNIQAVLHYSGVLLYWVERTHPEFFMLIEDMVTRKQAEIIGGGFYEPMLPIIPVQDRIGQIELLTTYLRKHFGKRPAGCWIPDMAWEQTLITSLAASDMGFTFLSQEKFMQAGAADDDLYYPCITEDQGKIITVFPVSLVTGKQLAEKSSSQVFLELTNSFLNTKYKINKRIISVFPEKASSSAPGANKSESPDTAWNRFFEELSLSKDTVETVLPSRILKTLRDLKKISFTDSPAADGSISPRRFINETCEANGIYSKMIFTNMLISQLKGDKTRKQNAREELWKAQDSCFFMPGDGAFNHDLRKSAYNSLLRAERLSREKGKFIPSLITHDFDLDGNNEYLFQDLKLNIYIQLKGAGIFELDFLPKDWNYLDCGSTEKGRRASFTDILAPSNVSAADFSKGFPKKSRLCFNEYFEAQSQDRKGKCCFMLPPVSLPRINDGFGDIEINKCYLLKKDILTVTYTLKNTGKEKEDFSLFTEINFSFAGNGSEYTRFFTVDASGKDTALVNIPENTEAIKILDVKNEVQLLLSSSKVFSGAHSVLTRNDVYLADRFFTKFTLVLDPGETWTNEYNLKFSH